ncbi:hypothetical protein QWY81_08615 [Polaribacter undariae]|uniref:Uncharacterized protein n=1 Tax=Polaribacter sejongensis TaxID=985043 RepID=A0AAJ1VGE2_9FLAO|nr:hypothetical protein [Polaribacter undariae]MDN3619511.1 hypothetical protein [Polaribacter undariae]UWD32373.1 hypothetical protein NQP51_01595 [Polaribacter undariae]
MPEIYLAPIYKVDYGDATADKPQSKSWSTEHGQWLIIGDKEGPKLLKKDISGWTPQTEINEQWTNLPRKADVFKNGNDVHIVFVDQCALSVVKMTYSIGKKKYETQRKKTLSIPENCKSIETATITQDSKNEFWVCADMNETIMVWHSLDGKEWSTPFTIAGNINKDDISLIVKLENQVSVIWSNQNTQSVYERIHYDGDKSDKWSQPIIIQQGNNNADDHLNATVFENGEMMIASKNSVDQINQPQFVLRVRDKKGHWANIPYELLNKGKSPSRPIINHVTSGKIFEAHSVKNKENNRYHISINEIKKKNNNYIFKELIRLKTKIKGKNGDVTSSKDPFFSKESKFIFFSDDLGNIYSFDLDLLF